VAGLKWHGTEVRRLIEEAGHRGIVEGVKEIQKTSQDRVLVQTGELKRSSRRKTEGLKGIVYYTDSKAVGAHENLAVNPKTGRNPNAQAKFLESAASDRRDDIVRTIAEEIRKVL
jgi:N-methylhydantoinase B/oxoprolinase/acetone carboxylase alpha subunit